MKSIGIIGLGTIGRALASGLRDARPQWEIFATRKSEQRVPAFVSACQDNRDLVRRTRVLVVCTKPAQLPEVLAEIQPALTREHIVVSVCAQVTLKAIEEALPQMRHIVRAMPNIACEVRSGVTGLCFSSRWERNCRDDIIALFESLGRAIVVDERHFDAITAIGGCGPAYASLFLEALVDAGVREGLDRAVAHVIASQMLHGCAALMLTANTHPAQIRDRVTTPGGATINALAVLERAGFRSAVLEAVAAAARHARAL